MSEIGREALRKTLERGSLHTIIGPAHTEEGQRVVSGWPDDKVRVYAENWVARAEARQDTLEEAVRETRSLLEKPVPTPNGTHINVIAYHTGLDYSQVESVLKLVSCGARITLCCAMFCLVWAWHFLFAVMFLPSMIALVRGHHRLPLIILANIFLGWTPFWFIILAYAAWREQPGRGGVRRYPRPNVQTTVKTTINNTVRNEDGTIRI